MTEPPVRRNEKLVSVTLDGYLVPMMPSGQPYLLELSSNQGHRYVVVFSAKERLDQLWKDFGLSPPPRISKITDGAEFVESLRETNDPTLHLAIDPYRNAATGKIRWLEIPLVTELPSYSA